MCVPLINMTGARDGEIEQHHNGSADREHGKNQVELWLKPDLTLNKSLEQTEVK